MRIRPEGAKHISPGQSTATWVAVRRPGKLGVYFIQALKGRNIGASPVSQSLVKNLVHLVFSTKGRAPWIPEDVRDRLYAYQSGIFKQWNSPALAVGGVEDHVHALFSLSKNHALKVIVEEVKKGSSKWMKSADGTGNKDFYWQSGYAAFSVSQSNVDSVIRYIASQEQHHHGKSFQDELRALFDRHEVEFDERYVWD